jgi:hypothetical protein
MFVGYGGSTNAFYDSTGKRLHSRVYSARGDKMQFGRRKNANTRGEVHSVKLPAKYKYFMGLDDGIKDRLAQMQKPYPKRATSETIDTAANQVAEGGAAPTVALHS